MPRLPHHAITALLRHYQHRLTASTALSERLVAAGLINATSTHPVPLGLVDRTAARVLEDLSANAAREWRTAWRAAGLLRADGRERFAGCVVAPLRLLQTKALTLASLPLHAVLEPQGIEVDPAADGLAVLFPSRVPNAAALFACSDPFDAAVLRALNHSAAAVMAGPAVHDANITELAGILRRLRPRRLRLLCASTAAGERASDAWRAAAESSGIAVDSIALPAGCTLRTVRCLAGALRLNETLTGRSVLRASTVAPAPSRSSNTRLPWGAPKVPLAFDLTAYVAHLSARGQSRAECQRRALALGHLWEFCEAAGVTDAVALRSQHLERFQHALVRAATDAAAARSVGATIRILSATRGFLSWAQRTARLGRDLAGALVPVPRPAIPQPLVLSASEVEHALAGIATGHATGLRDRAMLELLYGTGIRRAELVGLDVTDLDVARGVVRVRRGKGGRARLVPLGRRAALWVRAYLDRARPRHLADVDEQALFLSRRGRRIGVKNVTARMHARLRAAGITKGGSCHIIRHSVATLMHDGGADIRDLQALLGHALLTSTQIYTRVSLQRLQEVVRRTHPAEQTNAFISHQCARG